MPCYDARDEERQAAKVETVLCAVVTAFGFERVLDQINPAECGVTKQWIEGWWQQHQRKDEIHKRIREANATHVLHSMIEREEDIVPTVLALGAMVPAGSGTFAPPMPCASAVLTCCFGNVRVMKAFDPAEGRMVMRADLYYREAQR